ncbi:sialate O-acetylesterase [Pontibacter sp. G13]|uniref:sialate O-acetylesterase n=1 Tax=Pontibacter sp. G13 TaxID=3074898 RepID=UPI00288A8AD6|nr:sialate O-acetylesterase [Pontibacter sp. G13]WNJ18290.1 sialate O-acetylesterase [Pontibacter sp. G13]
MKKIFTTGWLLAVQLFIVSTATAELRLPAIVSSNMVLQRNTTVEIWGWSDAQSSISIQASWLDQPLTIQSDSEGKWRTSVKTSNSQEPQTLMIRDEDSSILLENILFGEVWLCSGQSNMSMPVKGNSGQPTFRPPLTIAKSANSQLRLFTVKRKGAKTPQSDVEQYEGWAEASPENVPDFSAVAYFFGQQLQEILQVPVGMIHTSWGGSQIQAWMSQEAIQGFQQVNLDTVDISKRTNKIPTTLYNAMIHPLIPFSIRGVLWYQGEGNRFDPASYQSLFPAMVKDWRARWNLGDFPFFYVQIAPYMYGDNEVFQTPKNTAFIREVQMKCLDLIPNSGMAVTLDIGDDYCIHPPKKKEVADRLLFHALHRTYGMNSVDDASPMFESMEAHKNGLKLTFKHAESGLYAFDKLEGFEIAGEDRVFYPANAKIIQREFVHVSSEQVPNPVAVRYAWRNWVKGTLFDTNLLPASSFRTDDWDDATRAGTIE